MPGTAPYVELHAHSAYSFLDGASLPEELAARAAELGYDALALTDHDGVYGSLEFAHAAKHFGVRPITGAEVSVGGAHVTLLCETQRGYANLCRILTDAHARTRVPGKERDLLPAETSLDVLEQHAEGLVALSGCARHGLGVVDANGTARLARAFEGAFYVELQRPYERGDVRRNARLQELAETLRVPTVATGDVHAHHLRRARLQDALVAIRNRTSLDGCERERRGNHESVLLSPAEMLERLPRDAALRTREVADRCVFDLTQELGYRYPDFSDGVDPADVQLRAICDRAFEERYGNANGHKRRARERLDDELALISRLNLAGFFLLHWEVLELARDCALEVRGPGSPRHALPPGRGRGSSVGSIVCYLTGLSHVDPVEAGLSLGRFINDEMVAVPDIDLDFPRDIREKLIVRVTERYGRERAALVATFATYRSRGAIRDVGKALGLPLSELERLARVTDGWDATRVGEELEGVPGRHAGPRWEAFRALTQEIAGLPRHVSQHPGGMVISTRPLVDLVPVQPAAMAGRQICQWDKDSCGDAGFLKIDLLGLGMLSAIEDAIDRIARLRGETIDLSRIPLDDQGVYEEIQAADTVGVFQIESRAQMQSLLQTRPENLDDLTVQVALVRPGPIQGKAVHPYVKHRHAKRADPTFEPPVEHECLREALRDTLGVVVFQDQVLDVAMAAARFSIGEAEGLRRAMSRKRSEEAIEALAAPLRRGCARQRHRRGHRERDLRQGRRLRRVRVPEVARRCVRAARLPVGVAAAVLPGGVPVRAHERAADGLLPAVVARARRAAARGRGAAAARQPLGRGVHDRGRRSACRRRVRERGRRRGRARDRGGTAVHRRRRPRAARRREEGRARGARRGRRVRRVGAATPAAVAARRDRTRRSRSAAATGSSRSRSSRRPRSRHCRRRRRGSRCSPTTSTRRCRSASIRSSCCVRICRRR